jgi:adenosine deaminase
MRLGDNTGSSILMDEGCLKKHLDLLYDSLPGKIYFTLNCGVLHKTTPGKWVRSSQYVLDVIKGQLASSRESKLRNGEFAPLINVVIIATRKEEGDLSDISRHLALAIVNKDDVTSSKNGFPRVVGVDLAGYESKETRASYYQADFIGVHRCGIAVTAHAGENDDAEGIWQAVYSLHTAEVGTRIEIGRGARFEARYY